VQTQGITFGPRLNNGNFTLIMATDNDFSVTQVMLFVRVDGHETVHVPVHLRACVWPMCASGLMLEWKVMSKLPS
jgi:hypothetical protein